jgi:hypothetical protein
MSDDLKKNMLEDREVALNRMRSIDFQVDTLSEKTSTGGYFTPSDNTITINYVEGDKAFNEWSGSKALLIHEQKHRDNQKEGLEAYAVSDEQAYKIGMCFAFQHFDYITHEAHDVKMDEVIYA